MIRLALALALGAVLAADTAAIQRGREALRRRQYPRAVRILEPVLAADPESNPAAIYLGYAYGGLHRCEEAMELLRPRVAMRAFTAAAARMAATCAARLGEASEAVYFSELALLLSPEDTSARVALALYADWAGDDQLSRSAMAELELSAPEDPEVIGARASLLLAHGLLEEAAEQLDALPQGPRYAAMRQLLLGRLALDLGEPDRAVAPLRRSFWRQRSYLPGVALWAEAVRRQGAPEEALTVLDYTADSLYPPAIRARYTDAVRARVAVDLGDLHGAAQLVRAALDRDPLDPEAAASAWYLSRARGDGPDEERWAARYRTLERSPQRTLTQLIPL